MRNCGTALANELLLIRSGKEENNPAHLQSQDLDLLEPLKLAKPSRPYNEAINANCAIPQEHQLLRSVEQFKKDFLEGHGHGSENQPLRIFAIKLCLQKFIVSNVSKKNRPEFVLIIFYFQLINSRHADSSMADKKLGDKLL